ncbi:8231_t:CDS:2, partial [Racocetra fulgida]
DVETNAISSGNKNVTNEAIPTVIKSIRTDKAKRKAIPTVIKSIRTNKAKRKAIPTVKSSMNSNDRSNVTSNVEIEDGATSNVKIKKNETPSNGDFILQVLYLKGEAQWYYLQEQSPTMMNHQKATLMTRQEQLQMTCQKHPPMTC